MNDQSNVRKFRRSPSTNPLVIMSKTQRPNVTLSLNQAMPALVNEYFQIELVLENNELYDFCTSLHLNIQEHSNDIALVTQDGLILPTFDHFSLPNLPSKSTLRFRFFCICTTSCDPLVEFTIKLTEDHMLVEEIRIPFIDPFFVEFLTVPIQSNTKFLTQVFIKNLSPLNVIIEEYGIVDVMSNGPEQLLLSAEKTAVFSFETYAPFEFYFYWKRNITSSDRQSPRSLTKKKVSKFPDNLTISIDSIIQGDGIFGEPVKVEFVIRNNSEETCRLVVTCDSPDNTDLSGPKKVTFLSLPGSLKILNYVLVPLECGRVLLPQLQIKHIGVNKTDEVAQHLIASVQSSLFVTPKYLPVRNSLIEN